jgi:hypothetical protein
VGSKEEEVNSEDNGDEEEEELDMGNAIKKKNNLCKRPAHAPGKINYKQTKV